MGVTIIDRPIEYSFKVGDRVTRDQQRGVVVKAYSEQPLPWSVGLDPAFFPELYDVLWDGSPAVHCGYLPHGISAEPNISRTYEITEPLLLELKSICGLATEAWDDRKANAATNEKALSAARCGWRAYECWSWLDAIQHRRAFAPRPFESVHCTLCGDRTDSNNPHNCSLED